MERMTFEGNFCDIAQCREIPCPYNGACSQRKVWERLKAYEDTHMMPSDVTSMRMDMAIIAGLFDGVDVDRMKELTEADKDGRLVVRCKDCEYSYDEISYLCCSHGVCVDCEVPPNFYCAYGKRRAEKEPPEEGET
jgi:hypothetical protein